MGIFDRAKKAVGRTSERVVSSLEEGNPEAVYEAAIDGATQRLVEHRGKIASLMAQQAATRARAESQERELTEVMAALQGAVADGDDDVAVVLITRKDELTAKLETTLGEVTTYDEAVSAGQAALAKGRTDLEALKREREVQLANKAVADAAIEVYDAQTGLSEAHAGLASVREAVGALDRRAADGYVDSDGVGVKGRAEAMGRKAREASARAQLEALEQQHATSADDVADDEAGPSKNL